MDYLFLKFSEDKERKAIFRFSFLEIYNEKVRDLLTDS